MVLIFAPMNNDVKNINIIGATFIIIKNINFLSLKFILNLSFEIIKKTHYKKR